MSAPTPTGRLVRSGAGHDLVLTRSLPLPVADVWVGLTDPERTARWFGRWEGEGAVGATIRVQLGFEETAPWVGMTILACEEPRLLRVLSVEEGNEAGADGTAGNDDDNDDGTDSGGGTWDISTELTASASGTELRFVMHGIDPAAVGEIGPGWEYYLDQFEASLSGGPLPDFSDYFPAQRDYFEAQAR
ncbi:hypothetical protein NCCP2495_20200 [Dietzia sp. NCCP-2495]|uniref:SRPBCC domain-containing protein n=1 Tax=Dietzia sp. NCCP-2495 TaxID=2934675 RepID=UPI00222E4AFE|nr:SRPBCC domain-containing protein [Dietzia sp. NCCP-2495]GLB64141.1 hypothetical protein NCCP2495_20200 [Dietzia sp. NCCP-2495]